MTTIEHNKHRAAIRYLGRIRNPIKRSYGVKYWDDLNNSNRPTLAVPEGLSYMAAQAVRMTLQDIHEGLEADYNNWDTNR